MYEIFSLIMTIHHQRMDDLLDTPRRALYQVFLWASYERQLQYVLAEAGAFR